jgi:hypothetical protein
LFNNNPSTSAYIYIDDVSLTPCTAIEEQNQNSGIRIYPNPVKDFINISFTKGEEKNRSVEIFDLYGRRVSRFSKSSRFGKSEPFKIDMRDFSKGIYLLEVTLDGERMVKKIVKE